MCVNVCMHARIYVCLYVSISLCIYVSRCLSMYVCMQVCMSMCLCMSVCECGMHQETIIESSLTLPGECDSNHLAFPRDINSNRDQMGKCVTS